MRDEINKPLLVVAMPTRGDVSFVTAQSMQGMVLPTNFSMIMRYVPFLEVGRAYNILAHEAMRLGAKYMLTWEEDVVAPANGLRRLLYHMETKPELSCIASLYATKTCPPEPMVYTEWGQGSSYGWRVGGLVPVLFTGMGFTLFRVADLARLEAEEYDERDPWTGQPIRARSLFVTTSSFKVENGLVAKSGETQDAHLFRKMADAGMSVWVDTSTICSHYDKNTKTFFLPPIDNGTAVKPDPWNHEPRIANLGCGGMYDPYEVGVDLRDDPTVTYHCDVTQLPADWEGTFDVVKASHVLEHFDFERTPTILAEWCRIVKPGGELRLEVPDLEWAAQRIVEGTFDTYIMGHFWGDEGHPFWMQPPYGGKAKDGRWLADSFDHNHHKSGFTPKYLATRLHDAGLVDIITTTARGILSIVGKKPVAEVTV